VLSQTEENYLKGIFKLTRKSDKPISTNAISKLINTTAASVTDMLKRLAVKKLVHYEKYRGVQLTVEGESTAKNLVRKHRLWEVFLVKKLKFTWDEVHEIAEQLEHIKSPLLTDRLDDFLGNPQFDPHGDPIPNRNGRMLFHEDVSLQDINVTNFGEVVGVKDTSSQFLQYLDSLKIKLGSVLKVVDHIDYDGSRIVEIDGDGPVTISKMVAKNLYLNLKSK